MLHDIFRDLAFNPEPERTDHSVESMALYVPSSPYLTLSVPMLRSSATRSMRLFLTRLCLSRFCSGHGCRGILGLALEAILVWLGFADLNIFYKCRHGLVPRR